MLSDGQVRAIRSRFPIFKHKIYLNSCSQGALSDSVDAALRQYMASWHEGGSPWELWVEKYEAVRAQFARFIGAEASEVAVIPSASAGMNSIASAFDFAKRRKVVMGEFEFPTMGHVWLAQQRRGAQIEFIAARERRLPAQTYAPAIDEQTAVVPLTDQSFNKGL